MYILIVDDDRFVLDLMRFVFEREGYKVKTAENVRIAKDLIVSEVPQLLILDDTMVYQNGFEFARDLKKEGYKIPIIFTPVKDSPELRTLSIDLGAVAYITKPFHHEELVKSVNDAMRSDRL